MCMIKGNSNIKGICTGGNKFKITQFAAVYFMVSNSDVYDKR